MFLINLQGKESIYEQIRCQIEKFIDAGVLKSGDKLPSVRSMAEELGINPNTVMKAYQELEKNGYIYTLNKKGVFVNDVHGENHGDENEAKKLLILLKEKGYEKDFLLKLVREVYEEEIC